MKDIKFSDYDKRRSKYNTGKIPITKIEREIIEQRKRESCIPEQRIPQNNIRSQQSIRANDKTQKEIKKQRKNGCTSVLISILLIFSILSGTLLGYLYSLCSKTQYEPSELDLSVNFNNINNNVYNVLLIGTDKEENGASRSDSMILVTLNKNTDQILLTSFMRDLWVSIPGHDYSRLNAAYSNGGAELLMKTISNNFDIKIDNYVLVDFEMFKEVIDSIGGVAVEITPKEAEFMNRTTQARVKPGINTLDGFDALIYCRIRKLDSDFMRTQRQRKVISAIVEKIKSSDPVEILKLISDILPLITTDISPLKMTTKILSSIEILNYTTDQIRIPSDGTYTNKTINGQAVLVPNYNKNIDLIHSFIYKN